MSRPLLQRLLAVASVATLLLAPARAHATSGFRFFTDRAQYLAALVNPAASQQVDLDAIATPGGSVVVGSLHGGLIAVSTLNQQPPGTTSAPMVVDPSAVGLPASYGTGNLLTFAVDPGTPSADATGSLFLDLLAGDVTGAAFEYGRIVDGDPAGFTLYAYEQDDDWEMFTLPAPPAGGFGFVGVTIDPDAATPATNVSQLQVQLRLAAGAGDGQVVLRAIEYTTSPVVAATVPEPATVALVAGGLAVLGVGARRRRPPAATP